MNDNDRKSEIYRTRILKGEFVNSIRNNGGHYFLVDMPVYEDGVFNCWEYVDIEGMKDNIRTKWISYNIPDGTVFSKTHLGRYKVKTGNWNYKTGSEYIDFLLSVVKKLNPDFNNLLSARPRASTLVGNTNYSKFAHSSEIIVRKDNSRPTYKKFLGKRLSFFYKLDEENTFDFVSIDIEVI